MSLSNNQEETNKIVQKLEGLASLLKEGCTENMFQFEEVTFFEKDVHNMTKEVFETILIENGFVLNSNSRDDPKWSKVSGWFPSGNYQSAPSITGMNSNDDEYYDFWSFKTYTETEEHMPIGVRDIYTYDALEDVLTELGFSNGKKIAAYINDFLQRRDIVLIYFVII